METRFETIGWRCAGGGALFRNRDTPGWQAGGPYLSIASRNAAFPVTRGARSTRRSKDHARSCVGEPARRMERSRDWISQPTTIGTWLTVVISVSNYALVSGSFAPETVSVIRRIWRGVEIVSSLQGWHRRKKTRPMFLGQGRTLHGGDIHQATMGRSYEAVSGQRVRTSWSSHASRWRAPSETRLTWSSCSK